jgi:hypothetical protein
LVSENKEMDLMEGLAPSKAEKQAACGVRGGYVGAPTTPGALVPNVGEGGGGEGKKNKENLRIMMKTWTKWCLTSEPFRTSWP